MERLRFLLLIITAFTLFSCKPDDPVIPDVYEVPDELQPYIDQFVLEAGARDVDIDITNLKVEYSSELEGSDGTAAAGLCWSGENPPRIQLDTTTSNWTFNEYTREVLVFHELGHCMLRRSLSNSAQVDNHKNDRFPNGNYASIMRSGGMLYGGVFNAFKREYYLDELFDQTTSAPDWADAYSYEDISQAQKQEIFVDEFVDNRNNWNLVSDSRSDRTIMGGYYEFKSKISGASFAARTINFDESIDFEIEASLKIVSGESPTMLMWGAANSGNKPYFHGYSADSVGLYGSLPEISMTRVEESVKPEDYNVLTVRKIGDNIYFFINQIPFDNGKFEDFFGNVHGFYVGGNATVRADYLRVYEIMP